MAKVLMFSNIKGGVGKTTFAYLTAATLPVFLGRQMKILAIDLDPQANLTDVLFGGDRALLLQSNIQQFFEGRLPLSNCITVSRIDHVDLVPSQIGLSMVEQTILHNPTGTFTLKYALENLEKEYDLVIIDAPPSLGLLTMNGLIASDVILCPVSPDTMALEGFKYLNATFERLSKTPLGSNKKLLLVLNLLDRRYVLHKTFEKTVKNAFGDRVIAVVSRRSAIHRAFELKDEDPWTNHISSDRGTLEDLKEFFNGLCKALEMEQEARSDEENIEEKEKVRE